MHTDYIKDTLIPSIKDDKAIENIIKAAFIANESLDLACSLALSGVRASYIDKEVEKFIIRSGAYPANLEVENYGYATSISRASEIAHGTPTKNKILMHGEPVCIDLGVKYNGYYADSARSIVVNGSRGYVNHTAYKMVDLCKEALENAIYVLKPGVLLSKYGKTVQKKVKEAGFTVVKFLTGHGIGYEYHEAPHIFNFYHPNNDVPLKKNMVLAFELMITNGSDRYKIDKDGWTLCTEDYSLAVHFEHTVLITETGVEILGLK